MESFLCPFLSFQWRSSTSKGHTLGNSGLDRNVFLLHFGPKGALRPQCLTSLVASFMLSRQQSKSISFLLHSNGCHGFGLEGCCDRDPTHRCPAENRESTLCRLSSGRRRKLKLPVNRVLEQEELGLCLARVSSLHRAKWEKGPGEAGALVLSWMVNEAAEKGDQISWLWVLKAQIRKRIALLGGFSHPILWGFM